VLTIRRDGSSVVCIVMTVVLFVVQMVMVNIKVTHLLLAKHSLNIQEVAPTPSSRPWKIQCQYW
jgi:hypothetical protein